MYRILFDDMAGGRFAAEIYCMECLGERIATRAVRIYEGVEDDRYRCERGHEFGVDWSRGPAMEPQWPPPAEIAAILKPSS